MQVEAPWSRGSRRHLPIYVGCRKVAVQPVRRLDVGAATRGRRKTMVLGLRETHCVAARAVGGTFTGRRSRLYDGDDIHIDISP